MFKNNHVPRVFLITALSVFSFCFPIFGLLILAMGYSALIDLRISLFEKLIITVPVSLVCLFLFHIILNIVHLQTTIYIDGLLCSLFGLALVGSNPRKLIFDKIISSRLILPGVLFIITLFLLFLPLLAGGNFYNPKIINNTIALVSNGEDNASHYALFKYNYSKSFLSYGDHKDGSGLIVSLINYPQQYEFTMAWTARSIGLFSTNKDSVLILYYYLFCALQYAYLIGLLTLLALVSYQMSFRKRPSILGLSAIFSVILTLVVTGPLLMAVGRGFHNQITAYIYLLLTLYLLISKASRAIPYAITIVILFIGTMTTWWFVTPALAVPLVIYILKDSTLVKNMLFVISSLLLCALAAYPILLNTLVNGKGAGAINEPGGIDIISIGYIVFLLAAFIISRFKRPKERNIPYLTSLFVSWLIFTSTVGIYQILTIGQLSYYFYKSLYLLVPISLLSLGVFVAGILDDSYLSDLGSKSKYIVAVIILFLSGAAYSAVLPVYPRVFINNWFDTSGQTKNITWAMSIKHDYPNKYTDIIFVGGCQNGTSYTANRWTGAMFLNESATRSQIENASIIKNNDEILMLTKDSSEKVLIGADENCLTKESLTSLRNRKNVYFLETGVWSKI